MLDLQLRAPRLSKVTRLLLLCAASCRSDPDHCRKMDPGCNAAAASLFLRLPWTFYDPRTVPGLRFWVKAEGLGLTEGTAVNQWPDLSGMGNSIVPGAAPNYYASTTQINGRPVVRFVRSGSRNLVKTSPTGVTGTDSGSTFAVFRMMDTGAHQILVIGPLGAGGREIKLWNSGTMLEVNKSGAAVLYTATVSWAVGAVHQISVLQNAAADITVRFDGAYLSNGTPSSSGFTAGDLAVGLGGAEMDLAELLFYDNRVSDRNAADIECYLGARYGTKFCP